MKKSFTLMVFIGLFIGRGMLAQEIHIDSVLDSAHTQLSLIKSYSVDATFEVDIDFVSMPNKSAHIEFEAPDKFNIKSDGFLMIPKLGMRPMTKYLDIDNYHPIYLGNEEVFGDSCMVIKMVPKKKNSQIILATLWIYTDNKLVKRWELFSKKAGNILVDLFYDEEILPSKVIFSFELSGMNIPLRYFGNEVEVNKDSIKASDNQNGKVTVYFKDYTITLK